MGFHAPLLGKKLKEYFMLKPNQKVTNEGFRRFFFFLSETHNGAFVIQPVTPKDLRKHINTKNHLPANINRHYLRSSLRHQEVPGEKVDVLLGHWRRGTEPWGRYSGLSPRELRDQTIVTLNKLMAEGNWEVESGL